MYQFSSELRLICERKSVDLKIVEEGELTGISNNKEIKFKHSTTDAALF